MPTKTAGIRHVWAAASIAMAVVAVLWGACAPRTTPEKAARSAPIRTDHDRYVLRTGPVGHEATIVATFTAPAETTVYIVNCNEAITWGLQRLVDDRWTDAWMVATNGCLSPPIVVPGGQAYRDTLTLVSRTDVVPDQGPIRHEIPPGMYRVVLYNALTSFDGEATPLGEDLALEQRVSGPITIDRAP